MSSIYDAVLTVTAPRGHWERVAAEVTGLASLRGLRLPSETLEWLDIRELLALRSVLLEPYRDSALRRRLARIAGGLIVPSTNHDGSGPRM
jgi:hypothetical protein